MKPIIILALVLYVSINFCRQMVFDIVFVARVPISENIFNKRYQQTVAFNVGLFSEKVYKFVIPPR